MTLVYIVGGPAAGKSTLMAELTIGCHRMPLHQPVRHDALIHPATGGLVGIELGRRRETFSGTDALPMNVSPRACEWIASPASPDLVLGEGDRLGHASFLASAAAGGHRVIVVHLGAPPRVLDARCEAPGSTQDAAWRRGRITKAQRLAGLAADRYELVALDSHEDTPPELARQLRAAVPALGFLPTVQAAA